MNLIEQLGWYEKAIKMSKEWESSIDGDIPLDTMMYSYDFGIFSWGDLQSALLEYRRQHNIFEVEDKVVYVDEFMHDGISAISSIDDRAWLNNDAAVCIFEMIRHATDEEIKAGKRL